MARRMAGAESQKYAFAFIATHNTTHEKCFKFSCALCVAKLSAPSEWFVVIVAIFVRVCAVCILVAAAATAAPEMKMHAAEAAAAVTAPIDLRV